MHKSLNYSVIIIRMYPNLIFVYVHNYLYGRSFVQNEYSSIKKKRSGKARWEWFQTL